MSYQQNNTENYGCVDLSNLRRRRRVEARGVKMNQLLEPRSDDLYSMSNDKPSSQEKCNKEKVKVLVYKYNTSIAAVLTPSIFLMYAIQKSPVALMTSIYALLVLYGFDLCGSNTGAAFGIWVAFGVIIISFAVGHYQCNGDDTWGFIGLFFDMVVIFCTACWGSLQFEWLSCESIDYLQGMEGMLHMALPIASSVTVTRAFTNWIGITELSPYLLCILLYIGVSKVGKTPSSFCQETPNKDPIRLDRAYVKDEESKFNEITKDPEVEKSIPEWGAKFQSYTLLFLPTLVYMWQCTASLSPAHFNSLKNVCSLFLLMSMSCLMFMLDQFHTKPSSKTKLNQNWTFILAAVIASATLQYSFFIPTSMKISHYFHDEQTLSPWSISLRFCVSSLGFASILWTKKKITSQGELLLGQQHENICSLGVLISSLIMESAVPLPRDLQFLALLSTFAVGICAIIKTDSSTILSAFVNCSGLTLSIYQRVSFDEHDIILIPRYLKTSISKFSMLPNLLFGFLFVMHSIFKGNPGDLSTLGPSNARRKERPIDITGSLLLVYSVIHVIIEGGMYYDVSEDSSESTYTKEFIVCTSIITMMIAVWLRKRGAISIFSAISIASISIGKFIATLIGKKTLDKHQHDYLLFLYNVMVCSFLCMVMLGPSFVLKPIQSATVAANISARGKGAPRLEEIQLTHRYRIIMCYCGAILPLAILSGIPTILLPGTRELFGDIHYYRSSPTCSEFVGYLFCAWGVSTLLTLWNYAPEGGLQAWRKIAFAGFMLGALLLIIDPLTIFVHDGSDNNKFLSSSSIGIGRSLKKVNGTWGVISAALSVSVAGPLKISKQGCVTKAPPNRLRISLLSFFFGSGVSWFFTNQLAVDLTSKEFILVTLSTSVVASVLTFSSILVCFMKSKKTEGPLRTVQTSIAVSFVVVLFMIVTDKCINGRIKGIRIGGCHTINLFTCSLFLSILSFALASIRKSEGKVLRFKRACSVLSWITALSAIHASFGLASIGVSSNLKSAMGVPISIILTVAVCPILGNCKLAERGRTRITKRSMAKSEHFFQTFCSTILEKPEQNICLFGTLSVFIVLSIYAIFLRGIIGQATLSNFPNKVLEGTAHNVAALAEQYTRHKDNAMLASRLMACSVWTSEHNFAPIKHLIGLIIGPTLTWYGYYETLFSGVVPSYDHQVGVILNVIVFLFCKGIPSLSAASMLCSIILISRTLTFGRRRKKIKMSI